MTNTNLTKTNIIPIVNYLREKSFANVDSNRESIAERSWNTLKYFLLDNPELTSLEPTGFFPKTTQQSQTHLTSSHLNIKPSLKDSKHITVGVIFNTGHVNLVKEEIIQAVRDTFEAKNALIKKNIKKDQSR